MDEPRTPPAPTAAAAEKPLQPTAPPEAPITTGKGVKETIESILIAFILAFVFRAFVVEAFVIPTGSMATTLLGAHMRFTCKECGYQFDVNFPSESRNGEEVDIPAWAGPNKSGHDVSYAVYCPNCRFKVSKAEATNPPVRYGDRILVLKYLYIPWISSPHRWDVVVFKTPTNVGGAPLYTTNYIKRLVGLPGEELMVLDGDVYARKSQSDPWVIQAKPKYAQDALWRVIYDHDFRPLDNERGDGWSLPWVHNAGDGWDTGDKQKSRVITFKSPTGGGRLKFDPTTVPHYNPERAPGGYFTDWMAYDVTMSQIEGTSFNSSGEYPVFTVSDLKLSFFYERKSGDGPFRARMTKHDHEFVVEFEPSTVRLKHQLPDGSTVEIPALKKFDPSKFSGPIHVDFSNSDYHVTVRLNDDLIFQTTPEQYHPNVDDLLARYGGPNRMPFPTPAVSLDAARQEATFSHVSLWRDVYYTPEDSWRREINHASPSRPMQLGSDEFFVMGDNSAASSDARYWMEEVHLPDEKLDADSGRVPGRFMLGRAFFVYWPAGYRPLEHAPALVPDFGDMRLIH
jgi:signal peptidase I